jgi:hypothetical protein
MRGRVGRAQLHTPSSRCATHGVSGVGLRLLARGRPRLLSCGDPGPAKPGFRVQASKDGSSPPRQ